MREKQSESISMQGESKVKVQKISTLKHSKVEVRTRVLLISLFPSSPSSETGPCDSTPGYSSFQ